MYVDTVNYNILVIKSYTIKNVSNLNQNQSNLHFWSTQMKLIDTDSKSNWTKKTK